MSTRTGDTHSPARQESPTRSEQVFVDEKAKQESSEFDVYGDNDPNADSECIRLV